MRVLAIDFGTSNTVAALRLAGGASWLVTIDGSPLLPSSVYLSIDGSLVVGHDADRQAGIDPSRYEPNPKRRIDDGFLLLGRTTLPVCTVIAAVLRRVGTEVRRQLGGEPDQVRLTHPARWGQHRKGTLLAAAREAGLGRAAVLIPEPVAAAAHFAAAAAGAGGLPDGLALAVYDLGGGTFDVSVLCRGGPGYQVLAEAGLPDLGGLDFDHAILAHLGASQAGAGNSTEGSAAWRLLRYPTDQAGRRQARTLATDVRAGKEALSRYPHVDIPLPAPFPDVHLTRAELEDLIRPQLSRSVELLASTIAEVGMTPGQLAGVYLVGGSSRIPLVARLIQQGLGITPSSLDQPETAVVTGALELPVGVPVPRSGGYAAMPPSGGHAALPPSGGPAAAARPPGRPRPSRSSRWLIGIGAGALVVLAVAGLVLATRGGGAGPGPVTASGSGSASQPPLEQYFADDTVRGYVRPTFGEIRSCRLGFGSGPAAASVPSGTTCSYANGIVASFARATSVSTINLYRDTLAALLPGVIGAPASTGSWQHGHLDGYPGSSVVGLYWDDNPAGILGFALVPTGTMQLTELRSWWRGRFG